MTEIKSIQEEACLTERKRIIEMIENPDAYKMFYSESEIISDLDSEDRTNKYIANKFYKIGRKDALSDLKFKLGKKVAKYKK